MKEKNNLFAGELYERYTKRFLDVILSIIFFIIFIPVSLAVAIAIKINSKGSILADVPERIGQNNKGFKMFKFR